MTTQNITYDYILNNDNIITDVIIENTNIKMISPLSLQTIKLFQKSMNDNSVFYHSYLIKMLELNIDSIIICAKFNTYKYNNNTTITLNYAFDDFNIDNDDITIYKCNIDDIIPDLMLGLKYNNDKEQIASISYLLHINMILRNSSNKLCIVNDCVMSLSKYNILISIDKELNYNSNCWVCLDDCLMNEKVACCNHNIHIKCALQIKELRRTNKKQSEYKCGVCTKKLCNLCIDKYDDPNDYNDTDNDDDNHHNH